MKYPVVYPYRATEDHGLELRHSLRSLSNLTNFNGDVYVIGDGEIWFNNINFIAKDQDPRTAYRNVLNACLTAVDNPNVPDNFIWMNDDFYVTKPSTLGFLHGGVIQQKSSSSYHRYKSYIKKFLMDEGIEAPLDYDIHVPMILNKDKMKKTVEILKRTDPTVPAESMFRSIYGNFFIKESKFQQDAKSMDGNLRDQNFISTLVYTDKLNRKFPDKSIYELDDVV